MLLAPQDEPCDHETYYNKYPFHCLVVDDWGDCGWTGKSIISHIVRFVFHVVCSATIYFGSTFGRTEKAIVLNRQLDRRASGRLAAMLT
jgi:hypothetical protein